MSEPEKPTPPQATTPKTAAVPLKKETVRITLRARPGAGVTQPRESTAPVNPATGGVPPKSTTSSVRPPSAKKATAPVQLPSAPLPPPAPRSATAPVKLPPAPMPPPSRNTTSAIPVAASTMAPSAPPPPSAPTPRAAPPAPPAAPRPPTAGGPPPTAPKAGLPAATMPPGAPRPAAPPRVETGATTAPLAAGRPPMAAPRPTGSGTAPLAAGGKTAALPKATVKLQPGTQPMARPSVGAPPSSPAKRAAPTDSQQFYEEKDPEAGLMPLSVICAILSVVLMFVQMMGSDAVVSAEPGVSSPIMVPANQPVDWETKNPVTGVWTNSFAKHQTIAESNEVLQ